MTALLHSLKAIVEVRGNKTLWLRNSSLFAYNHTGALIQTDSTASPLKMYYIFQHSIFFGLLLYRSPRNADIPGQRAPRTVCLICPPETPLRLHPTLSDTYHVNSSSVSRPSFAACWPAAAELLSPPSGSLWICMNVDLHPCSFWLCSVLY